MPTTAAAVRTFLGLATGRPVDDDAIAAAVLGANDTVFTFRPDLDDPLEADAAWPGRIDQAATIQAARYYGRRSSLLGAVAYPTAGGQRLQLDEDVATMLELGGYQPSVVA